MRRPAYGSSDRDDSSPDPIDSLTPDKGDGATPANRGRPAPAGSPLAIPGPAPRTTSRAVLSPPAWPGYRRSESMADVLARAKRRRIMSDSEDDEFKRESLQVPTESSPRPQDPPTIPCDENPPSSPAEAEVVKLDSSEYRPSRITVQPLEALAKSPLNIDPAATLGPIDATDAPAALDLVQGVASPPGEQFGVYTPPPTTVEPAPVEFPHGVGNCGEEGDASGKAWSGYPTAPLERKDTHEPADITTQHSPKNIEAAQSLIRRSPEATEVPAVAVSAKMDPAPMDDAGVPEVLQGEVVREMGVQGVSVHAEPVAEPKVVQSQEDERMEVDEEPVTNVTDTGAAIAESIRKFGADSLDIPSRGPAVPIEMAEPLVDGEPHVGRQSDDWAPTDHVAPAEVHDETSIKPEPSVILEEGEEELDEDAMDVDHSIPHEAIAIAEDAASVDPSSVASLGRVEGEEAMGETNEASLGTTKGKSTLESSNSKSQGANAGAKVQAKKGDKDPTKEAKKTAKSKGKNKVDDLRASGSKPASSASPSATRGEVLHREESVDPDGTAVYCVCRKPYSEEEEGEVMVGCDACDNWFHPACIGFAQDQLERVEMYICKSCERSTAQRTLYKVSCKRDGCGVSVVGRSSKYCSSKCAFKHSSALVAAMSNKRVLKQLASSLAAYPPPSIDVNLVHHLPTPPPSPEETGSEHDNAEQLLQSLQSQISATMEAIELVQRRQQVLAEVIERAAAMASVAPVVNGDEAKSSKTKRKGNGGGGDVGPCGWEPMLVWDDDEVRAWQGTEGEGTSQADGDVACMLPKRRCERHLGWQRTANASLEMEARALERRLQSLQDERDSISRSMEAARAAEASRNLVEEKFAAMTKGK